MYNLNDVKKVQVRLLEMAKSIRDVLEGHNIPYFITYGTLLGAIRHKGFIPWDDDFDFYLFDDTYDIAIDFLRKELPKDMFVEDSKSEPLYFHGWAHIKDLNSITECELFPQDGFYAHKGISVDLYRTKRIYEAEENVYRLTEHLSYLDRRNNVNLIDIKQYQEKKSEIEYKLQKAKEELLDKKKLGKEMYAFYLSYDDRLFLDEIFPLVKYEFEDTYFKGPNRASALLSRCYKDFMKLPPENKRRPHYSSVTFLKK